MKRNLTLLLAVGMFTGLLAGIALGTDGGVDEPWNNSMNQPSYWEARFGADKCNKYEGHDGFFPARYEAGVIKDGQFVRVYANLPDTGFQGHGPINPNTNKPFDPPHSWVMKCNITVTTTTTVPEETTTVPEETTTTVPETTTTQPETTTTEPEVTTTVPETTTTQPVTTTDPEKRYLCSGGLDENGYGIGHVIEVGPDHPDYDNASLHPGDPVCNEVPELPFTGMESDPLLWGSIALTLLVMGAGTVAYTRR